MPFPIVHEGGAKPNEYVKTIFTCADCGFGYDRPEKNNEGEDDEKLVCPQCEVDHRED